MALTTQINGTTSASLITASWWNDFKTLLTGSMPDQPVALAGNLTMKSSLLQANSTTANAVAIAGGAVDVGTHQISFTYVMSDGGETLIAAAGPITTTSTNKTVSWTGISAGPTGTVARNIYRTKVGTTTPFYKVGTISDNTTATFSDSVADSTLTVLAPTHSTFGGALIFKDATNATTLTIYPDGTFGALSGATSLGATTVNGNLTVTGDTFTDGKLSRTIAGDIIDASGTGTTYIKSVTGSGGIAMQVPNGTTVGTFNSAGLTLGTNGFVTGNISASNNVTVAGLSTLAATTVTGVLNLQNTTINVTAGATINASNLSVAGSLLVSGTLQTNSTLLISPGNTSSPSAIQFGTAGLGFKNNSGTRLMEIKNTGVLFIAGSTFTSTSGSVTNASGGTFDAFDTAETFFVDQEYPAGTILCPTDVTTEIPYLLGGNRQQPLVGQCTHDKCNVAMITVTMPGNCMGMPNVPSLDWYDNTMPLAQATALNGRVFAKISATTIAARSYVCSDGLGGVRAIATGESAQSLGVSIGPVVNGMVPLLVRPTYVVL